MSVTCPRCESLNLASLQYCDYCGYELKSEAQATTVHDSVTPQVQDDRVVSAGMTTEDELSKDECLIDQDPFIEGELWVELGTFLNEHLTNFEVEDVQNIDETKRRVTGVTEVDLSDCELKDLPRCLGLLMQIESLNVSGNKFKTVPEVLRTLVNLRKLELWDNKLKALPEWLSELNKVIHLDVSDNKFNEFPEVICAMTQLKVLDISTNKLTELPHNIGQLIHLQDLDLSSNELTALTENFSELRTLSELNLSGNQLSSLPTDFETMTEIVSLDLDNNNLLSLPEDMGAWSQLTYFSMLNNSLSPNSLPPNLQKLNEANKGCWTCLVWFILLPPFLMFLVEIFE